MIQTRRSRIFAFHERWTLIDCTDSTDTLTHLGHADMYECILAYSFECLCVSLRRLNLGNFHLCCRRSRAHVNTILQAKKIDVACAAILHTSKPKTHAHTHTHERKKIVFTADILITGRTHRNAIDWPEKSDIVHLHLQFKFQLKLQLFG